MGVVGRVGALRFSGIIKELEGGFVVGLGVIVTMVGFESGGVGRKMKTTSVGEAGEDGEAGGVAEGGESLE